MAQQMYWHDAMDNEEAKRIFEWGVKPTIRMYERGSWGPQFDAAQPLNALCAQMSDNGGGVVRIPHGLHYIKTNFTIPTNVFLIVDGEISIDSAVTLTMGKGFFCADRRQAFFGSGDVVASGSSDLSAVCPENFGALGSDAAVDDSAGFTRVVTYIGTNKGTIDLAPVTYYVNGIDISDKEIRFVGKGKRSSILRAFSDAGSDVLIANNTSTVTGQDLKALSINASSSDVTLPSSVTGLAMTDAELFTFEDVGFRGGLVGADLVTCSFGNIISCVVGSNNEEGIRFLTGSDQNNIENLWCDENRARGVVITNSKYNKFGDCFFQDNTDYHAFIGGSSQCNEFHDCLFRQGNTILSGYDHTTGIGVRCFSPSDMTILKGCIFERHSSGGDAYTAFIFDSGSTNNQAHGNVLVNSPTYTNNDASSSIFDFPATGDTTLVGEDTTQTLTNKTIGSGSSLASGVDWGVEGNLTSWQGGFGELQNLIVAPTLAESMRSQSHFWTKGADATITDNASADPSGGSRATSVVSVRAGGGNNPYIRQLSIDTGAVVDGRTFTVAVWLKYTTTSGSNTELNVSIKDSTGANITSNQPTLTTSWVRWAFSGTAATPGTNTLQLYLGEDGNGIADTLTWQMWGLMLFEGADDGRPFVDTFSGNIIGPHYGLTTPFLMMNSWAAPTRQITMQGNENIYPNSGSWIWRDPNTSGAGNRNLTPTGTFPQGFIAFIGNEGPAGETLTFNDGTLNQVIDGGERAIIQLVGATWKLWQLIP